MRHLLGLVNFEKLFAQQQFLPVLQEGVQLDRTDVKMAVNADVMAYILGPKVHTMLRGPMRELLHTPGSKLFAVMKRLGVESSVVLPCDSAGIPAYGGPSGATSNEVIVCVVTPEEEVLECVVPTEGAAPEGELLRFSADMLMLTCCYVYDTLPAFDDYSQFIFVCDPAGDCLQFLLPQMRPRP